MSGHARTTLMLLLFAATSCREDQGIAPATPAVIFAGITSTDMDGRILSVDTSDWKPVPGVGVTMAPAYPNPCTSSFALDFSMDASDSIEVTLNPSSSTVWETIADGQYGPGQFKVTGFVQGFPSGIYRVYFSVTRNGVTHTSYGDIQVTD